MPTATSATVTPTPTLMEGVSPPAPRHIQRTDITRTDTTATMETASATTATDVHAMKMAALSTVTMGTATMEVKMAPHSLSGDGYFLPYREVRHVHLILFIKKRPPSFLRA